MKSEFKYDVFISYSTKDREIVHALAERLKQSGLRVWLDAWAIMPGDSIPLKIQRGLEQSRTLLMCMSPDYFTSEWGRLEHLTLLFRDPTNVLRRFIPLLIEDCKPPDIIAQFARIDWRAPSDKAYASLQAACLEVETGKTPTSRKPASQARMVLRGHADYVGAVAVTSDGRTIISGSDDGTLKIWDMATGKCRATLEGHADYVRAVAVTPDGRTVISGSSDKTLKIWNMATGKCRATLEGHAGSVYGVAITPDGRTVISGSLDKTLKIWDLATGKCRATLEGHADYVMAVAVTPDDRTVISGSDDKTLKIWDLATGKCRATLKGHEGTVWGVAVTPDDRTVISGSDDKTLKIWDLATG
ncbi:MAG: TIR domain-containing protein, partial [Methanothrix sp.]|nr:TIR domain-containing protein [Methanothrix sp.]